MKDIDFDELDKAVSSLMGTPEAPKNTSAVSSESAAQAVQQPETVVSITPEPVAVPTPVSRPTPMAAPAVRRGKFMDMVNTSSPLKPAQARPAQREGLTIAPRPSANTAPAAIEQPQQPETQATNWPDPIDMPEQPISEPITPASSAAISSEPIESPFLTDAKVEKRPLNAGSTEPFAPLPVQVDDETATEPAHEDSPGESDEPPVTPTVPELDRDLVAIESSTTIETPEAVKTAATTAQPEPASVSLGAGSIPQQYKEKQSSGDQSHAAIYDATEHSEPLSHPGKKKSGWLWVLWVVILLALGAGGAVLLYSMGVIT